MLNRLLKEVVSIVAGKQFEEIVELLNSKNHVNEFIIAKKLDLTINQTRNILYKISNENLVSSIRKKDKRKGWYTYYWKIDVLKSLEFLRDILLKKIECLKEEVREREKKVYYHCTRCNLEVGEEDALSTNFSCNECGDIYSIKDNSLFIKELKKEVSKFEEKLNLVKIEVDREKDSLEKKKVKFLKKVEKEKQDARKVKREQVKTKSKVVTSKKKPIKPKIKFKVKPKLNPKKKLNIIKKKKVQKKNQKSKKKIKKKK